MAREKGTSTIRKRAWPHVYSRTHRTGQTSYVVDLGLTSGKRERRSFKTKDEAQTFAEQKRVQKANQGAAGLAIPYETKIGAVKAHPLLSPHSASLEEAAKYYIRQVVSYRSAPSISQIVELMISDAEKNDRRDRTTTDIKSRLRAFAEDFPNRRLSELTLEEPRAWIDEDEEWSARTRINYLTKLSQLYNHALRHKWVDANPAERLDRPSVEDKEPEIFTVPVAEELFKNAKKHDLLSCISPGLFAGLRPAELMRMEGRDVNFDERGHECVRRWLTKHPRFVLHFIPTSSSWLNLVESWFEELSQKAVRRGAFYNVADLEWAIEEFKDAWNANPAPFVWTATVESILEKLTRCRRRLDQLEPGCTKPNSRKTAKIK